MRMRLICTPSISIATAEGARGQGVGREILRTVVEMAWEVNQIPYSVVRSDNRGMGIQFIGQQHAAPLIAPEPNYEGAPGLALAA